MHNISKESIHELAVQLVEICLHSDSTIIIEKSRELYEKSILFHYTNRELAVENVMVNSFVSTEIKTIDSIETNPVFEKKTSFEEVENQKNVPFSVEEQIKQIMEKAAKLQPISQNNISQAPILSVEVQAEKAEEIIKSPEPLVEIKKSLPQTEVDQEMKETIPADVAADMFERVEQLNTKKKSLNDILSKQQIQIGLNDRIAFVKHLFNGNLADFNRVLSQLNSFETESQAKYFINTMVKTEYDWSDKIEYEMRLYQLIERKFL